MWRKIVILHSGLKARNGFKQEEGRRELISRKIEHYLKLQLKGTCGDAFTHSKQAKSLLSNWHSPTESAISAVEANPATDQWDAHSKYEFKSQPRTCFPSIHPPSFVDLVQMGVLLRTLHLLCFFSWNQQPQGASRDIVPRFKAAKASWWVSHDLSSWMLTSTNIMDSQATSSATYWRMGDVAVSPCFNMCRLFRFRQLSKCLLLSNMLIAIYPLALHEFLSARKRTGSNGMVLGTTKCTVVCFCGLFGGGSQSSLSFFFHLFIGKLLSPAPGFCMHSLNFSVLSFAVIDSRWRITFARRAKAFSSCWHLGEASSR